MAGGKPIPKSQFALPGGGPGGQDAYPVDTVKRARNALSRIAQHGTPEQKAKVRKAVQRRYSGQISVGGSQSHSNGYDEYDQINLASIAGHHIPGTGYKYHHGWVMIGGMTEAEPGTIHNHPKYGRGVVTGSRNMFPKRNAQGKLAFEPGVKPRVNIKFDSGKKASFEVQGIKGRTQVPFGFNKRRGLPPAAPFPAKRVAQTANDYRNGGRVIGLSRRLPVRQDTDIMVSRAADGTAVVRHRRGGNEVGQMKRTEDGWTPVVNGKALTPHRHQRAALIEMFGTYNREAAAEPFVPAPVQTPLMRQYDIPAVRLANDDGDNDDAASSDTSSSSGGLTPRGQGIYKKLVAKGVKPAVAMAMAKRAQNKTAGSFGGK